jgi:hypothetical protein
MDMKRRLIILAGIIVAAFLIAGGFALSQFLKPKDNPVPASVSSQIDYTPLVVPANMEALRTSDYKVSTVEDGTKLLSYIIHINDATVTVSEYTQPSQFTDVPDFKDKFLENVIQKTTSVSTASGTVILGQQAKQQNRQLAIMLERGLVVLMNPSKALEQKQWRTIGDALEVIKPSN